MRELPAVAPPVSHGMFPSPHGVSACAPRPRPAFALAAVGEKVLLVDSDPQGNASTGLGVGRALRRHTLYDVLMGEKPLLETVVRTSVPGLDLVPADPDLSGVELELGHQARRSFKLRDGLLVTAKSE